MTNRDRSLLDESHWPSCYRWILIGVAVLILSSCRSPSTVPLDEDSPSLPGVEESQVLPTSGPQNADRPTEPVELADTAEEAEEAEEAQEAQDAGDAGEAEDTGVADDAEDPEDADKAIASEEAPMAEVSTAPLTRIPDILFAETPDAVGRSGGATVTVGDLPHATPTAVTITVTDDTPTSVDVAAAPSSLPTGVTHASAQFTLEDCDVCLTDPDGLAACNPPDLHRPLASDEYLCDGGDQEILATVGADAKLYGLGQEDTVLRFDTLDGKAVVEPSNRVCIYAPRFAAVRSVTGVEENERHLRMARVAGETRAGGINDRQMIVDVNQPVGTVREVGTKLANSLDEHLRGVEVDNAQRLEQQRRRLLPFEDSSRVGSGVLEETDVAQLLESANNAVAWTDTQAVQMTIDGQQAFVGDSYWGPRSVYQFKLAGKPRMRVVKLASTDAARPGQFVDFTIRFDNVGTQAVNNVTIVDNLTTRLEYVADTAECDLPASFSTETNQGDSLILRWEIREPMKPGEGGVIQFRCRVR